MTSTIVLDPGVVLGAKDEAGLALLQEWTKDDRVRLGEATWSELAEYYADGSPGLSKDLIRISHRTFGNLLTREPIRHIHPGTTAALSVQYNGRADHERMIAADLLAAHSADADSAFGTHHTLWHSALAKISCDPPPPSDIPVHLEPGLPTEEDKRRSQKEKFAGRRVLIVGGQIDAVVIAELEYELGVTSGNVRWVPSEKNKRARNLKSIIRGLPAGSVVVCVVGKVGHDVSGEVEGYASRCSLALCEPRYASHILDGLRGLSL